MPQTVNGKKETPQRQQRPGQRQQERLMRLARRRRRRQIWTTSIVVVVLIILASVGAWQYQRITAEHAASVAATATTVANNHAHATATAVTTNCFISPTATTKVPAIYTAKTPPKAGPDTAPQITGTPVVQKDGLKYVDMKVGTGPAAKKGSTVTTQYVGWLASTCKKFDSSYDHQGQAFSATIGKGEVIKGFDEGLVGVKVGTIRRLYIPSALAYGANPPQGAPIPPNADLIFDLIVTGVK